MQPAVACAVLALLLPATELTTAFVVPGPRRYSAAVSRHAINTKSSPVAAVPDYYEILDVPTDATESAIKDSYRRLAKNTHPDSSAGDAERFAQLSHAYR